MTFLASCGRCILILLNVIFVLISLAILALGVILKFFPGALMRFMFEGLRATVPFTLPTGTNDLDIVPLLDEIGLALIILGAVLFGVAFFACCGACCHWRLLLVIFCACVILLMVAIATLGGLFLTRDSPLHQHIKAGLRKRVHDEYRGPQSSDIFSLAINTISYSMQCCAISGPEDFNTQASWTRFNVDGNNITISVTPACCTREYLNDNRIRECTQRPFLSTRTYTQGCYTKLLDLIHEQRTWTILGLLGLLLFLFLELTFSILLIRDIGRSGSRPI